MNQFPNAARVPIEQPSPQSGGRAITEFLREVVPQDAGVQHIQNAREHLPVRYGFAPSLGSARREGEPEIVRKQRERQGKYLYWMRPPVTRLVLTGIQIITGYVALRFSSNLLDHFSGMFMSGLRKLLIGTTQRKPSRFPPRL